MPPSATPGSIAASPKSPSFTKPRRVSNKNRLYCEADIQRLLQIRRFTQEMGVNLAGVEIILDLLQRMDRMQIEMDDLRRKVESRISTSLVKIT